jgi:hypothetical protein
MKRIASSASNSNLPAVVTGYGMFKAILYNSCLS